MPDAMTDVGAVLFDLDDTLIVEELTARDRIAEALRVALASVADRDVDVALGCARRRWRALDLYETCSRLGISSWEGLWATFEGCHRCLDGLAEWASAYRQAVWKDALAALGADVDQSEAVGRQYVIGQRRGHPVIERAVEAARFIGKSVPIGMLTNGPPDIQRHKLSRTGLELAPETVVISAEVGTGKPEPEAFTLALDRIGARAAEALMVGDSWQRDVLGALRMGMQAVWVSKGRPVPERLNDVLVVDELTVDVFDGRRSLPRSP